MRTTRRSFLRLVAAVLAAPLAVIEPARKPPLPTRLDYVDDPDRWAKIREYAEIIGQDDRGGS